MALQTFLELFPEELKQSRKSLKSIQFSFLDVIIVSFSYLHKRLDRTATFFFEK